MRSCVKRNKSDKSFGDRKCGIEVASLSLPIVGLTSNNERERASPRCRNEA